MATVPKTWMSDVPMKRIIVHWTAGTWKASSFDRGHYHMLIEDDGNLIRGFPPISGNARNASGKRANHTLNCNTESIGVSLCCMGGNDVRESPFRAGKWPLTRAQWNKLPHVLADLCTKYKITVSPETVLSHAEVQRNLKIQQRQKWDISKLPFDLTVDTAKEVGDLFRARTQAILDGEEIEVLDEDEDAGEDGGEPDDTQAMEEAEVSAVARVATPAPANAPAPTDNLTIDRVTEVQEMLKDVGFPQVGKVDGFLGPDTKGAITAYRDAKGLSNEGEPTITEELVDSLRADKRIGWKKPVSEERANATAASLQPKIETADAAVKSEKVVKAVGATGIVGLVLDKAADFGSTAQTYLGPIQKVIRSVPPELYLIGGVGVGLYLWYQLYRVKRDTENKYRSGQLTS